MLTSAGLTESTKALFLDALGKDIQDIKIILIPDAALISDSAREGLLFAMDALLEMGIRWENMFVYHLNALLSKAYQRTYSSGLDEWKQPPVFRLMTNQELAGYDAILFVGGSANALLDEVNRTGFAAVLKAAVEEGLFYLGVSAGSMIAAGNLPENLGYLSNVLIPHCAEGSPCGPVKDGSELRLTDEQAVWVQGDRAEIIA